MSRSYPGAKEIPYTKARFIYDQALSKRVLYGKPTAYLLITMVSVDFSC